MRKATFGGQWEIYNENIYLTDRILNYNFIVMFLKGFYTIGMLIVSNIFMTLAWYGHLKLQQMKITDGWPLIAVILLSWVIAFFEYSVMVPANRLGFDGNGGPFSLIQLKVIQEAVNLVVFMIVATLIFKGVPFHWNHGAAFCCLIAAVYFAFMD